MKKAVIFLILILIITTCFCGCDGASSNTENQKLKIVTTNFSLYDWTKNILGDELKNTDLTLLSDNGVDMHNYQPTVDDIIKIKSSDLIIIVGGNSDKWVIDSLDNAKKGVKVINMLDLLGSDVLYNNENHHEHNGHSNHNHKNGEAPDEHVWLSVRNAVIFSEKICETLSEINADFSNEYQENFNNYKNKLTQLDNEYTEIFNKKSNKAIIFADRFPFRYLTADYSLEYSALFEGCSAESDATIDSILNLSQKIDSNNLNYVFIIEGSKEKTAKTVIEHTTSKSQQILTLNSLQSVTKADINNGLSYYSVMETNLSLIEKSLK